MIRSKFFVQADFCHMYWFNTSFSLELFVFLSLFSSCLWYWDILLFQNLRLLFEYPYSNLFSFSSRAQITRPLSTHIFIYFVSLYSLQMSARYSKFSFNFLFQPSSLPTSIVFFLLCKIYRTDIARFQSKGKCHTQTFSAILLHKNLADPLELFSLGIFPNIREFKFFFR